MWWKTFARNCQVLSRVAVRILSMPATERSFKTQSLIHTKKRNRLDNKRVKKLTFVKHNLKLMKRTNEVNKNKNKSKLLTQSDNGDVDRLIESNQDTESGNSDEYDEENVSEEDETFGSSGDENLMDLNEYEELDGADPEETEDLNQYNDEIEYDDEETEKERRTEVESQPMVVDMQQYGDEVPESDAELMNVEDDNEMQDFKSVDYNMNLNLINANVMHPNIQKPEKPFEDEVDIDKQTKTTSPKYLTLQNGIKILILPTSLN